MAATHSVSGNPATVLSPAVVPVSNLKLHFLPTQAGSGTPSPSNIRAISGRTGITATQCGNNLLPGTIYQMAFSAGKVATDPAYRAMYCKLAPGQYTISRDTVTGNRFRLYASVDEPATNVSLTTVDASTDHDSATSITFTFPENHNYLFVYLANDGSDIASKFMLNAGSTAMAYEPYKEITYPVTFPAVGNNLLPGTIYQLATNTVNGVRVIVSDGSGNRGTYCKLSPGQYCISRDTVTGNRFRIFATVEEPANNVRVTDIDTNHDSSTSISFTFPEGHKYLFVYLANDGSTITSKIMLNAGSTAMTYEPFTNTVYGGELDVATGVLTIEREMITLTGTSGWYEAATAGKFYVAIADIVHGDFGNSLSDEDQLCNMYPFGEMLNIGSAGVTQDKHFYLQRSGDNSIPELHRVWVYDTSYTRDQFIAMLNENPLQVTCPVIPYTVQLSPVQVNTLLGASSYRSDANDTVSVTYDVAESAGMTIAKKRAVTNAPHIETKTGSILNLKKTVRANAKDVKVSFTARQELHGYSKPWVGGDGKNKIFIDHTNGNALSAGLTATKNSDGSITVKGTYTGTSNGYIGSVDDAVTLPAGTYILTGSTDGWYASYGLRLYTNSTYGYENGSGKTITLTEPTIIPVRIHVDGSKAKDVPLPADGLTFYPMLRLSSTTADYEPYENICPIYGGADRVRLNVTGKNMFNKTAMTDNILIDADGNETESNLYMTTDYIRIPKRAVMISSTGTTSTTYKYRIAVYNKNKVWKYRQLATTDDYVLTTNVFPEADTYFYIRISFEKARGTDLDTVQIETGTQKTTYESFGELHEVVFPAIGNNLLPGTVYQMAYAGGAAGSKVTVNSDCRAMYCKLTPGQYTISRDVITGNRFRLYASVNEPAEGVSLTVVAEGRDANTSITFTFPENHNYLFVYLANDGSDITSKIMLNTGNTAKTYEPYTRTVYGGTLDVLTGVLTVTHGYYELDADDIISYGVASTGIPYVLVNSPTNISGSASEIISNKYVQSNNASVDCSIRQNGSSSTYIYDSRFTSLATAQELLGTVRMVYTLYTPYTVQLAPAQVKTLSGINNIWEDTGNTTVQVWTH